MTSTPPTAASRPNVELVLGQLDSLPPLAPVATRILALTADPNAQARQITELISSDPSLTARVLSILGRAHHGLRPEAVNIDNAVRMLGFEAIRQIALAVKVMEVFGKPEQAAEEGDLNRLEFWKHCLAVACAARRLATLVPHSVAPEEAFVLGLLHDIGKIALHTAMPKSYRRAVRLANQNRADISETECAVLGVDHTAAGHRLAERWGLPSRLVEAIWLHHQEPGALPASVAAGRHVQIVQLADTLAREQRIGYSGNHRIVHSSRALAGPLGVDERDRQQLVETLAEEIEARAAWIGVEEITSREVYLRALLQSTEELSAVNAALSQQNAHLQRKAGYFAALGWLSQTVRPRSPVREICAAGAEAVRRSLGVDAALIFAAGAQEGWTEIGIAAGSLQTELLEQTAEDLGASPDALSAVQMSVAGLWISPAGSAFGAIVDRYRGRLGDGPIWLLPVICERRWVGGALFAAEADRLPELRAETAELEALSAAIGLAIAQSRAHAAAGLLSDELAQINRRWAAMQAKVLHTRTLESVVAMAAGAAHELNNPLAVISGRAQLLRGAASDEQSQAALDAIVRQAHECSEIVKQLLEFAQPPPAKPEAVALRDVVEAVRQELVESGRLQTSALTVDIPSDLPPVWFDRALLARIVRELVENAIEATSPDSRRLTIKAADDPAEENVVVTVGDNGRGMTPEVLGRALDPFFSHRPAGRGRGLGLARVARWLADGRGSIRIESEPQRGTRVEVRLPVLPLGEAVGGSETT